MNTPLFPQPHIPQQDKLIIVFPKVVLAEYRNVFNSEIAHLAEIAHRYLFLIITAHKPIEDIQHFVNQIPLDSVLKASHLEDSVIRIITN